MSRFSKHKEEWGTFIDVKNWKSITERKVRGKRIIIGTVTDPYNPLEEKFRRTRKVLEELSEIDCAVTIQTKSKLVLDDLEILKKMRDVKVAISLCTLDEKIASDLEYELSVKDRIETLKVLHENGVKVVLYISPILPGLTNINEIINECEKYASEIWFDALELRNEFKVRMLKYIAENHPNLQEMYRQIYRANDQTYWKALKEEIKKLNIDKIIKDRIKIIEE
jgi:DNA repair photolyase